MVCASSPAPASLEAVERAPAPTRPPVDRDVLEAHLRLLLDYPEAAGRNLTPDERAGVRVTALHVLSRLSCGEFDHRTACACLPLWYEPVEVIAATILKVPGAGPVGEDANGIWFYLPKTGPA